MKIVTGYGTYDNIFLRSYYYITDYRLCIKAFNHEDGEIATLTKCLCDHDLEDNETYLDTNNCPWVVDFIEQYKIGSLTGEQRKTGYCTYPVAKINMDELKKYME